MAEQAFEFAVTIPAGTPVAAPVTTITSIRQRRITAIRWIVPPGSLGVVGFYIGMRGVQVLPSASGTWFIRSGNAGGLASENLPTSGDWSVTGYNTGAFNHTVYVTFECELLRPAPREPEVFTLYDLSDYIDSPGNRYA